MMAGTKRRRGDKSSSETPPSKRDKRTSAKGKEPMGTKSVRSSERIKKFAGLLSSSEWTSHVTAEATSTTASNNTSTATATTATAEGNVLMQILAYIHAYRFFLNSRIIQ